MIVKSKKMCKSYELAYEQLACISNQLQEFIKKLICLKVSERVPAG